MVQCFWFQRFWLTIFPFDPNLLNKNYLNPAVSPSCISDWHKIMHFVKNHPRIILNFKITSSFLYNRAWVSTNQIVFLALKANLLNFVSTPKSQILMKNTNRIIFYALFIYVDDQISVTFSFRLSGVVVNVLALSAVDCGFEQWSGQTKAYWVR